jgi:hypothetical protein
MIPFGSTCGVMLIFYDAVAVAVFGNIKKTN